MINYITPSIYDNYPELIAVLSTRHLGSQKNDQKKLCNILSIDPKNVITANLSHGNNICLIKNSGVVTDNCDALITNKKEIFLAVTVADCLPIFLYDPQQKVCGLIHAGWRSLVKNIIGNFIDKITNNYGCNLKDLLIHVGPGIDKCHFEVREDVKKLFKEKYYYKESLIDLKNYAFDQFINAGAEERNIQVSSECTYCLKDKYFSFRRDKPKGVEAMAAIIGIK